MTRGYFWAPLMRRERQPGIGERSIGVVLVPLGGTARVRVLPGNEDLDWAISWIHAEIDENAADPAALATWWRGRAAFTEDPVRLGPPAPGVAEDPNREIEVIFAELRER